MLEQLVAAGLLYLSVIAIVLTIKPKFMFTEDGIWKEFGIGRNPATHTWMPFWLFAILWALISYILVTILTSLRGRISPQVSPKAQQTKVTNYVNLPVSETDQVVSLTTEDMIQPVTPRARACVRGRPTELPDGYYMLNSDATELAGGIPKYIFLGKGLPED